MTGIDRLERRSCALVVVGWGRDLVTFVAPDSKTGSRRDAGLPLETGRGILVTDGFSVNVKVVIGVRAGRGANDLAAFCLTFLCSVSFLVSKTSPPPTSRSAKKSSGSSRNGGGLMLD